MTVNDKAGTNIERHVLLLLDRSSSMRLCKEQAIAGFNRVAAAARRVAEKEPHLPTHFTLVLFDGRIEFVNVAAPLTALCDLTPERYALGIGTSLLDAIGATLSRIDREVEDRPHHRYAMTVITDGEENSSKEYSSDTVARMIKWRTATDRWTFGFVGANQDLTEISRQLGIPRSNTLAWRSDEDGTVIAFEEIERSVVGTLTGMSRGRGTMTGIFKEESDD